MKPLLRSARPVLTATTLLLVVMSCGGGGGAGGGGGPIANICNCTPAEPVDYRPAAKHVPLPNIQPLDTTVAVMLTWPQTPVPPADAPRTPFEMQLFHIAHGYLRAANVFAGDCDISMEISDTADAMAPRVIVETPVDAEYCTARSNIQQQLATNGFTLNFQSSELPTPLPVDVVGLAFQDFPHASRGSALVATVWELHPAVVKITQ
ncbi:MAG TPA: hypothetical protein VES66_02420 [Terriglobales bacterium]|nr:hypothetical protein [Terriglobales bacterium]